MKLLMLKALAVVALAATVAGILGAALQSPILMWLCVGLWWAIVGAFWALKLALLRLP